MATPAARTHRVGLAAAAALRVAAIALLVWAAFDPSATWTTARRSVVFLVDRSASVMPSQCRAADEYVAEATSRLVGSDLAYGVFAGKMVVLSPEATASVIGSHGGSSESPLPATVRQRHLDLAANLTNERSATDLEAALAASLGGLAPQRVPEVALLSDGRATQGDALRAARSLHERGVRVSVVPLEGILDPDAWIESVRMPAVLRAERRGALDVIVRSRAAAEGALTVLGDGVQTRRPVTLTPGPNTVRLPVTFPRATRASVAVRIDIPDDVVEGNNCMTAAPSILPPPRVLVIARNAPALAAWVATLRRAPFAVESRAVGQLPDDAEALAAWDLVALVDLPSGALSASQAAALERWVHQRAGGLVIVGGPHSLTAGGYRGEPWERLLPVVCEPTGPAQRPPTAVVLVVDRSQSMQEGRSIEMAKQAVRRAIDVLGADDLMGVLAFDESTEWLIPLAPLADKRASLARVDLLATGGRTHMADALRKGFAAFDGAAATRRHVVLLTDGISQPGDFAGIVQKAAARGMTLSTVALGREASRPLLAELASLGGGRAYVCDDPAAMPDVFALETAAALPVGIRQTPVMPRAMEASATTTSLVWTGPAQIPVVLGYVETRLRPEGRAVLCVGRDTPLWARRSCGAGARAIFASDVEGLWTPAWTEWPQMSQFWAAALDSLLPPPARGDAPTTGYAAEYQPGPADRDLLRRMAETTGGLFDPSPDELAAPTGRTVSYPVPLQPWLLAAAALTLTLEIVLRRW